MSYEIVVFLEIVVKFWMLAVVVGLPAGIIMALVEVTETPIYNHELAVMVDQMSVYEEDGSFYDLKSDGKPETYDGDIDADIETEEEAIFLQLVLELAEVAPDFNTAYKCLIILNYEEICDLANEVFELKQAA